MWGTVRDCVHMWEISLDIRKLGKEYLYPISVCYMSIMLLVPIICDL